MLISLRVMWHRQWRSSFRLPFQLPPLLPPAPKRVRNKKELQCSKLFTMLVFDKPRPGGETGRRTGLKIPGSERSVSVQFRSRAPALLRYGMDQGMLCHPTTGCTIRNHTAEDSFAHYRMVR